jgi:hypothetical protein
MVSIIGVLNRPSNAATPVAGATAGMGVPSRFRPGVRARARLTTVSAAALGTSARCSNSRAIDRYPNSSMTPRDSISTSREPISASADRTTVSSAEMRSARATASAFHTASLSTHQDYRHPNACSSHDQVEAAARQGHRRVGNRRSRTEQQARTASADFPRPGEAASLELGETHVHKGQQRTRPNKQADPKPTKKRLILPKHLDQQTNSPTDNGNEQSKNNRRHQEGPSSSSDHDTENAVPEKEDQLTKDGGPRIDSDVGSPKTGEASLLRSPRKTGEATEEPAEEGPTAQGIEAGKRGIACRPEMTSCDCEVATAGPSNPADTEWTTGAPERNSRTASSNPRRCLRLGSRCCPMWPMCPIRPGYLSRRRRWPG